MKQTVKRVLKLVLGWLFIVLGVLGLFLPVLQGILFLLIGLIILSSEYEWAHRWLHKLRARFPLIAEQSDKAHRKLEERWPKLFRRKHGGNPSQPQCDPESGS